MNAERIFESHFRQSGEKCESVMGNIFGTENKRQTQQLLVQEIDFCEGDNFEVIARLEMCEDCEWNWINLDFRIESRGPNSNFKEEQNSFLPKSFERMSIAELEGEIQKTINEIKQLCENKDFNSIMRTKNKLWPLNDALNQKSNNVWEEVDKTFKSQVESMTQEQRQEFDQNYGWIKQEQEKRKKVKEIAKKNYEERKQFYSNLFSGYNKKEFSFSQVEFQKRIVEEFKEKGEEICDNNQDDNENQAIDCADGQCGGKICGRGKNFIQDENGTKEIEVDFYCIEKECKAREEILELVKNISFACQELPFIECSEGSKAFFSRYDNETNCPIETSCLNEIDSCESNEDCLSPACGIAECIEKKCEVTGLTECRKSECIDGDEKICESNGKIVELCENGFWKKIDECEQEAEIREQPISGNECLSANDCGENNVCNNGMCQLIPQVIIIAPEELEENLESETEEQISNENEEENSQQDSGENLELESSFETEESEQENNLQETEESSNENSEQASETQEPETNSDVTGNFIFNLINTFVSKIKIVGAVITGFDAEEAGVIEENSGNVKESSENNEQDNFEENEEKEVINQKDNFDESEEDFEKGFENPEENIRPEEREEDRERKKEDEKRNEENKKRCEENCERPCVEKCIREECGEGFNCNVDEVQKKCEESCKPEEGCVEKCMKGEKFWDESKNENKEEKGIFQVGGNCRTSQGKTEGFIWFNGWGEPFEQIQNLKNKYYSGGQADWCKYDFENLKKQRQEFENSFNQEFVAWFFEKHLANSAENWEQAVSGIFEIYWKDVDNSRETAYRMQCLGISELPTMNLINVKYDTDYGSIEFWEEIKNVKLEGMDKEVQLVSPYMKIWVFPSKEFIIYEMKKSMKNHEFPGPSEEKTERENQEGLTDEERRQIKQDEKFMEQIKKISEKYGGNLDISIQFKDYETNEIIFNLYVQVNENEIINMKPMLPEEVPSEDVKAEVDFKIIYELIYDTEKEMRGEMIESPPWDRKLRPMQKIKEITSGIKMYFKMKKIISSAKITPSESEEEIKKIFEKFISMSMEEKDSEGPDTEIKEEENNLEEEIWESKESITGEIIAKG